MAKVLVVDDDAVNRDLVVTLLGYHDHVVFEARDGAEALETARREAPDLVITDLLMPVMDGYELIRELRTDTALESTPAIFYTANYLEREVRPVAAALGVQHVVSKPVDPRHLLRTVDDALTHRTRPTAAPPEAFHREHRRALSAKLADKLDELQRTEVALQASEARFRSLAQSSPLGIFSMSLDGRFTYANPRLVEICGRELDDASWTTLAHPDDRDDLLIALAHTIEHRLPLVEQLRLAQPDGGERWVRVQIAPVREPVPGADGAPFVGTVEDITAGVRAAREQQEMEQRLRMSQRLKSLGELSAGIAHDFNNLLSAIVSYSEFVSGGLAALPGADTDPVRSLREDADAIRDAADRAAELTRRLLTFARRDVVRPALVDVNDVVRGALPLLKRTIGEHVRLESALDERAYPVMADRSQLEQVVMNLVVNARDAVGSGGRVVVSSDIAEIDDVSAVMESEPAPGTYARLSVTDDGAGIDAETLGRVFEPFFTTKGIGEGTGLGLSTVYGIATRLGGTVTIYSEPGRGTSVHVYLPLAAGHSVTERGETAAGAAPPAGAGEVVLVCEDDDDIRAVVGRALTESGYRAVVAAGAEAALQVLSGPQRVDLLLSDLVMPGMSGRELADRAVELRPQLAVLFMSGYAAGVLGANVEAGPALLQKPFSRAALLTALDQALPGR